MCIIGLGFHSIQPPAFLNDAARTMLGTSKLVHCGQKHQTNIPERKIPPGHCALVLLEAKGVVSLTNKQCHDAYTRQSGEIIDRSNFSTANFTLAGYRWDFAAEVKVNQAAVHDSGA